jgi:hypothetical protein
MQYIGITFEDLRVDGTGCPTLEVALAVMHAAGHPKCDSVMNLRSASLVKAHSMYKVS